MTTQSFRNEWDFNQAVQALAMQHGWEEPFHIPAVAYQAAADSRHRIPAGFPDLMLRYHNEKGDTTVIVAELKRDDEETSFVSKPQRRFLEDLAQHIPAFIWRPRDWDYIERVLREGPPDVTGEIIEPSPRIVRSKEWLPTKQSIDAIAYRLVSDIASPSFPGGDLAGLRRMKPEEPDTPAFYQIMAHRGLLRNENLETRWALIVNGIALMTPTAHDGRTPVGEALFNGGDSGRTNAFYSDLRLNRLLAAQSSVFVALMTQLFRMMSTAGQPFDWREMAAFILSEGINEEEAEKSRRRIARSYYGTEYRKSPSRTE